MSTQQMDKMEERLTRLEAKLARLEARAQIEDLMGRLQLLYAAGKGRKIMDTVWSADDNISIEYGASGMWAGRWRVERFYVKEPVAGRLTVQALTSGKIEVADDGLTASGSWIAVGTDTDAGELGGEDLSDSQRQYILSSTDEQGRRYRAEWLWQRVYAKFVYENGSWRIHDLHIGEYFRCPFDKDWVLYSMERMVTDGMRLDDLFESELELPPQSHGENLPSGVSTNHWQYTITGYAQELPD